MKTININVMSLKSVNDAIAAVRKEQDEIRTKCELFVRRLAEVGIPVVEQKINEANYTEDEKGIVSGSNTDHYTHITVNSFGSFSQAILTVEGQDIAFIEFGAGVHYNGSAGSSPHPKGQELGYTIGSYGKGYGKQDTWGYIDESGTLVLTHGTKATMPVHNATIKIIAEINQIARQVFSK